MRSERVVPTNRMIDAFSWQNYASDLKIIYLWLCLAVAGIYVPVLNVSPFRSIFALPVVMFMPGYCLTAALFPGNDDLDGIERIALSVGLSIAIVPMIGLALNYTSWGIRLDPVLISLVIFMVLMANIAQYRRSLLPEEERFQVMFGEGIKEIKDFFSSPQDKSNDVSIPPMQSLSAQSAESLQSSPTEKSEGEPDERRDNHHEKGESTKIRDDFIKF